MSCSTTSSDELASTIPVNPPSVNKKMNPKAHSIAALNFRIPPLIVLNHLNTFTPVGTAITIVAEVKYARVSTSIPTTNMWCAHTINPSSPIDSIA